MTTNISGVSAVSTTLQHTAWCDPDCHDDGSALPVPDPAWQICFSMDRVLDFGERSNPYANVAEIAVDLSCCPSTPSTGARPPALPS